MTHPSVRALALASACVLLAAPTAAGAAGARDASGSGPSGGAGLGGPAPGTAPAAPTSQASVSTSGGGLTLHTSAATLYGDTLTLTGTAPAGATVSLERAAHGSWRTLTTATAAGNGSFTAAWQTDSSGRLRLRAAIEPAAGTARAARATSAQGAPATAPVAVLVYREAVATIYGPGLYGHRTACGQRLEPNTVGVASRTLRCGTKVAIAYDGRTVTVPVIDRGPFAHGATWDLTAATASELGDTETATVGVATL